MRTVFMLGLLLATASGADNTSVYTSLDPKQCFTISSSENETDAEVDHYRGECPGLGGYRALVGGGDLRYSLVLGYRGKEIVLTRIPGFHFVTRDKIEWRGRAGRDGVDWRALIYRLDVAEQDESGAEKDVSRLYVVRLAGEKSCLLGAVATNQAARALADDAQAPCDAAAGSPGLQ